MRFDPFGVAAHRDIHDLNSRFRAIKTDYNRLRSIEAALPDGAFQPEVIQAIYDGYKSYMFGGWGEDGKTRIRDGERNKAVAEMRWQFAHDPLIARAFAVYWSFVFGRGLNVPKIAPSYVEGLAPDSSVQSKDEGTTEPAIVGKLRALITGIWLDPITQIYLSTFMAQQRAYMRLKQDGELPIVVCANTGKTQFALMLLDSLELTEFDPDPKHPGVALAWKREYKVGGVSQKIEWYADIETASEDDRLPRITDSKQAGNVQSDKWLMVVNEGSDPTSPRGIPAWYSALVFSRGVNEVIKDERTYLKALSNWAWLQTTNGGQSKVDALAAMTASTLNLQHPVGPIAKVRTMPEGTKLEAIDIGSGGANAFDACVKSLKLMVCAGTGLPLHLFGDVGSGRMSTANSLDTAVIKMFAAEQRFIESAFDVLFQKVARMAGMDVNTERLIQIDFPELDTKDSAPLLASIAQLGGAGFPMIELARVAASLLGEDPEEWVTRLEADAQQNNPASLTEFNQAVDKAAEAGDTAAMHKLAVVALRFAHKVKTGLKVAEASNRV
jgi:hypothetical protein